MTNTDPIARREDMLRKVQRLLDLAASTKHEGERDSALAKADELMAAFAIEQFELEMHKPRDAREAPVVVDVEATGAKDMRVRSTLRTIFESLARHCGCMLGRGHKYSYTEQGTGVVYKVVGFRSDIDWLRLLYLTIQMDLVAKMEPRIDPALTEVQNYTILREAGVEIRTIFAMLGYEYQTTRVWSEAKQCEVPGLTSETRARLRVLRNGYRDQCKAEGRKPLTFATGDTYRDSFMDGYAYRLRTRLAEMGRARQEASTGHGLAVIGREDAVKETLWDTWPEMRPHPADCQCDDCHFRNCTDGKCKRPRCVRWNRDLNKLVRYRQYKEPKVDARATERGRTAADSVNLGRGGKVEGGPRGELR